MNEEWKGLSLVDLFDLLEPAPEPAPISMMPQTAGWIWLGLALTLLVGGAAWLLHRRRLANAYRRAALAELNQATTTTELAVILRRTALAAYPRTDVASLHGNAWLEFLNSVSGDEDFSGSRAEVLVTAPYAGATTATDDLKSLVRRWIKNHRRVVS